MGYDMEKEKREAIDAGRRAINSLNNCPPHSRYFSDELGGQIFAKLSN